MYVEEKNCLVYISKDNLKVVLSCLGASIVEICFDDDLLTLTPVNYEDLNREDIYYGKTIGPIANRVQDGLIKIENKSFYLPLNEKGVSNHSGNIGLSNKMFNYTIKDNKIIFTFKDSVFDSEVTYEVIYSFIKENEIRIDYKVTTSDKAVISLTNHTFFNLGESSIDNLLLQINADSFIETDRETLVPQNIKPVNTCLNFTSKKAILKDINDPYLTNHKAHGYDHCFILNSNKVELESTKYCLDIESNYPCCQIYSDNYPDGVITKNSNSSSRRAVAIEPEDNLLERVVIHKGEIYQRYIVYSFKKL